MTRKTQIADLLMRDVPARLATLDEDGYPVITPLWFLWEDGAFHMTSVRGRRHLRNLERDPRASLCIDTEARVSPAGARRNRLFKVKGLAELQLDRDGVWTSKITRKYVSGPEGEALARRRSSMARVLIVLRPAHPIAIGPHAKVEDARHHRL